MTVTTNEVLLLLEKPAQKFVAENTVALHIARSLIYTTSIANGITSGDNFDAAVRAMAAWLTYGSYSEGISQQLGEQEISGLREKLAHFRHVAEVFLNLISGQVINLSKPASELVGVSPAVVGFSPSDGFKE